MKTNQHRGEGIRVLFRAEIDEVKQEYDNGNKCGAVKKYREI
jgi:hypothetical protein